jgi:uncharacterized protein YdhG (YjbR/CyaY superfamily)
MKPAGSSRRATSKKSPSRRVPRSVEEYVVSVPPQAADCFRTIRAAIRSVMPAEAIEVISYGIPAFKQGRVLVWFGAFEKHCSLFPTASIIEQFKDELRDYQTSKGTVQFPLDKPVPASLIKKMVKARIAESQGKKLR